MRTPRLLRRKPRMVGVLTGLAVIAGLLVAPALPASATQGIVQGNPTEGVVVVGSSLTDQLQVSGANGQVTFSQTSGSDVTVSSSGQVSAPSTLTVGSYTASGTDSDTSGDSGTWTYTLAVVAPAPDGFANTVIGVYQSEYAVAEQLGQASAVQPISQYSDTVNSLNPTQLAELYDAVSQNPEWFQIPALMQTVASDVPTSSSSASSAISGSAGTTNGLLNQLAPAGSVAKSGKAGTHSVKSGHAGASTKRSRANLTLPDAPADTPVTPVARFTPQTCSTAIPDAAVFALQIVIDAAAGAYNILMALTVGAADLLDLQVGIGIAAIAAGGVLLAAQIVHDVLAYEQLGQIECAASNEANEIDNIDNTAVAIYDSLTGIAGDITQIATTDSSVLTDVQSIQNQLTTFQSAIIQTINTDQQTLQTTIGGDTEAVTTQIETDLTALHGDVTNINSDLTALSQNVTNQVNTDTSQVQSSISTDVTQILNETDSDATSVTNVVNTNNQQIINLIQGNFSTEQAEYYQHLRLRIETLLGEWGPIVPDVHLIMPASQGGLLNSTPVGVQEVVTADIAQIVADGGKVTPSATKDLKAANTALAAGQYLTAYGDYAASYEAFD